jgi:hypothetical protein
MWAELPTNLWADLPTAMRDGLLKRNCGGGRGAGAAGGGGKVAVATGPPHQDLCVKNLKSLH